jgi:hypothetical protein
MDKFVAFVDKKESWNERNVLTREKKCGGV